MSPARVLWNSSARSGVLAPGSVPDHGRKVRADGPANEHRALERSGIMRSIMAGSEVAGPTFASDDDRWAAVVRRDRRADGVFWYAVRTTGVYCRPSCVARRPRRENVRFYSTG